MTLKFETVVSEGISQLSYLIGDDKSSSAAVIDPRPDVEIYLELARKHRLAITHILETHIHADFMSGACELADRCDSATIYASGEGGADYGFDCRTIGDGQRLTFGKAVLTARHTPGHTPEHLSYLVASGDEPDRPWGVFTGDALFVGSAGRPDLLGQAHAEELEAQLFHTLRNFYLGLDDEVIVYPCHGAGSACGANISDRPMSTIGYERKSNPFLQIDSLDRFRQFVRQGAPPVPAHYPRLKKVNAAGPPVLGHLPVVPALPPEAFQQGIQQDEVTLLDTRDMLAFGGGHIEGAINIGDRPELSNWAGDMLDPDKPLLLVAYDDRRIPEITALLLRTGFTTFAGYLAGGMEAWDNIGLPVRKLEQMSVHELHDAPADSLQILDVRTPGEWQGGHVPGAVHHYVADMRYGVDGIAGFNKTKPTAVYCGSGYRASIAASLLQRRGFQDVRNVPGSWQAWTNANLPVEPTHEARSAA